MIFHKAFDIFIIVASPASPHGPSSHGGKFKDFIPDVGWIVASVLFFLLIIRDAIRDALKKTIDGIISSVTQHFSGSRLLRSRSIRLYRQQISMRLEDIPVPFKLPVQVPMAGVYIPLRGTT